MVSFSALTLFYLVTWPVKVVSQITYNVLSGMLSLYATTKGKGTGIDHYACVCDMLSQKVEVWLL